MNLIQVGNIWILLIVLARLINCLTFQEEIGREINEIDSTIIIKKLIFGNKINCLLACKKTTFCEYAAYNSSICILYSLYARFYLKQGGNIKLYRINNQKKLDLAHYWPIAGGEGRELIASKNLFNGQNLTFVADRFGNKDSAFKVVSGFYQAPAGIYFGESFTILAWAKLNIYKTHQRLFDFGNGPGNNNILVSLSSSTNKIDYQNYFNTQMNRLYSNTVLQLYIWHHLGFTADSGKMSIFINGTLDSSLDTNGIKTSLNVNRDFNYFGKSLWSSDPNAQMECDDVKIFNRILTQSEIKAEYDYGKVK